MRSKVFPGSASSPSRGEPRRAVANSGLFQDPGFLSSLFSAGPPRSMVSFEAFGAKRTPMVYGMWPLKTQRSLPTREGHKDPYRHAKGIIAIQIPHKTGRPPPYSFGLFLRNMVELGPEPLPEAPRNSPTLPDTPGSLLDTKKTVFFNKLE